MPEPAIQFRAILKLLDEARVRYVIIGGVALHLHGGNNLTVDIDISFARDRGNLEALAQVLSSQHARMRGFPPDLPCVIDAQLLRNATNLTLETDLGDFDLLAEPEGVDSFEGIYQRAVLLDIDDLTVRIASVDDLIAMKRAANRPKDQSHIMELEALKRLTRESDD